MFPPESQPPVPITNHTLIERVFYGTTGMTSFYTPLFGHMRVNCPRQRGTCTSSSWLEGLDSMAQRVERPTWEEISLSCSLVATHPCHVPLAICGGSARQEQRVIGLGYNGQEMVNPLPEEGCLIVYGHCAGTSAEVNSIITPGNLYGASVLALTICNDLPP